MQVMGHHSLCEIQLFPPLRGASESKLLAGMREHQYTFSMSRLWPGYEPISSAPGLRCSACGTWVGAFLQQGLIDRYCKAQPTSDTNGMVNLLLYSFYRFYLFFPWANKYTKTEADWPDSFGLWLYNDFWFP